MADTRDSRTKERKEEETAIIREAADALRKVAGLSPNALAPKPMDASSRIKTVQDLRNRARGLARDLALTWANT